ncbi:uncharacterized protein DUF2652 [Gelidibacter algens]|uniref:Uncharacterized protein DUF2652 n=1 Tax=Gelidibacter algens TaxID=49280 RepID=A0A1A7R388_9FLAO|nr:DUF2652 domain-containing protein [Gelidibacter algens]OBX25232.1 hypothetical protein A9996_10915 [Gelidibacter algens]RAJ18647.1 uncharacterized protein DUF2652 [Gelidibacter algens]
MQKALYFMPDISGFTNFVNHTEVEHSIHIISELLEILLDIAAVDFELAEIEGDALFLFTTKIPDYKRLLQQTTTMLEKFHEHTKMYETKRICDCGSCRTTTNLELKFLVHYGELNFLKVKNIKKPYGREVITIHRLLKNKVPLKEYILLTESVNELYDNKLDETWTKSSDTYDLAQLDYFYKNFGYVKDTISNIKEHSDKRDDYYNTPFLKFEHVFIANKDKVYKYISELKYRHLWDKDAKRIEFEENKLNRVGTQHNCVLNIGNLNFETISSKDTDQLAYGETTEDLILTRRFSYLIKLDKESENSTKVTTELYVEFTTVGAFMKSNLTRMMKKSWKNKLENLQNLCKK